MAASSATSYSLAPGEVVGGRYRIAQALGCGGMGEVYEAADQFLGETVALKTLRADLARVESIVRHFQKEIQLARRVTHANVCRVFEMGMHGALPFFTMELLGGETLGARLKRCGRIGAREAAPIVVQLARGLEAAHAAGVIHSDFKSGNIFLVPAAGGARAVITDFGLARVDFSQATGDETTQTMSTVGHVAGTPGYMSPEQLRGGEITAASDIYSFGIVLLEMATGELPRGGNRVAGVDARWEAAIARCLERDPAKRFAHAGEIAEWFATQRGWTRREWMVTGAAMVAGGGYWRWTRRAYRPGAAVFGWYQRGMSALHSMTYEAARRAFEQAVAADPGYAMAHAGLARAYEELDYTDLARESMLRAVGVAQESRLAGGDAVKLRALQFLVSRDYDRAAPLFQQLEAVAAAEEKPAAALETGWLAQLREDTDGAAAGYERALRLNPAYAAAKLRLGFIFGRRRQVDGALRAYQEAERLYQAASDPEGVTETLYERARLLNRSSRSAEALPVIERAMGVAKAVGNPYQQISLQLAQGVAVRNLGDAARAGELARQAIDLAVAQRMDNLATNGLIDLGNSYLTAGETRTAEPIFQRALELAGRAKVRRNEARARLSLASVYEQERRPKEGRALVEAGLPFFRQAGYRRELVQSNTLLGGILRELGELDKGAAVLREALAEAGQLHDPQSEGKLRERLAGVLQDQGAWPEAVAEFGRAVARLGALGVEARLNGAMLCARLGRQGEADAGFAEGERLVAKAANRGARNGLLARRAELAYREGRMKDAAAWLGEVTGTRLLRELVRIKTHAGGADAAAVLEEIDARGLPAEAASARLALAEAMAPDGAAGRLAGEALKFFESRGIYESIWRAHSVMAMSSREPAVVAAHRSAARAALARLSAQWTAADLGGYLKQRDAAALAAAID